MAIAVSNEKQSILLDKEDIYFAFQENRINKEVFLEKLSKIDNPTKNKWTRYLGKGAVLVISLLFPLFLFNRSID